MAIAKFARDAALAISLAALVLPAVADAQTHRHSRGTHVTEDGTVVHRAGRTTRSAYGEAVQRGRSVTVAPDGDLSRRRGGCVHGYGGSSCAGRDLTVDRRPDGSVYRESQRGGFTPYGEASSSGSFYHDQSGNYHGERHTSGVNGRGSFHADTMLDDDSGYRRHLGASGDNGSVNIDTRYRRGEGGSRTVTCYDAAGAVVACPY